MSFKNAIRKPKISSESNAIRQPKISSESIGCVILSGTQRHW